MRRRIFRGVLICILGVGCFVLLYKLRMLFIPFGLAVLIAYLVYPLVNSLESRGVSRVSSIITVYAAGLILAGIFFALFIPALLRETKGFGVLVSAWGQALLEAPGRLARLSGRAALPVEIQRILFNTSQRVEHTIVHGLEKFVQELTDGLLDLIAILPSFIPAPFIAYYLIRDFELLKKSFLALLPPASRPSVVYLLREADIIFSRFLRGHLTISLIVGFLTGLGAAVIGLKFYLFIGIFTAVADLVPVFGPMIAAVPAVGIAFAESRVKGVIMLIVFLIVQQLEGSVLAPRLLGEQVGLHPLAVMLVLLAGGVLFGPLGLIFSVPAAGLLRVVLRCIWQRVV
ncbi:MAG: AI-2E family transporter [Thermacetogeniaceae bacterium]